MNFSSRPPHPAPRRNTPLWTPLEPCLLRPAGGRWTPLPAGRGEGPFFPLPRLPETLRQTDPRGVAALGLFVPFARYRMAFGLALPGAGQEAKFILASACHAPASRVDFFGAHRCGAVRVSVLDEPCDPRREFDETGIDFSRPTPVRVEVSPGRLRLAVGGPGGRTFEKTYRLPAGKIPRDGWTGLGTYRGRAAFGGLRVEVDPESFFTQPARSLLLLGRLPAGLEERLVRTAARHGSFTVAGRSVPAWAALPEGAPGESPLRAAEECSLLVGAGAPSALALAAVGCAVKCRKPVCWLMTGKDAFGLSALAAAAGVRLERVRTPAALPRALERILDREG